ncbi:MAG: hypothetical protein HW401_302 [Parcubacteria group bacterium]|nr:hypothetical protein [Parcubacteria group bacterium]
MLLYKNRLGNETSKSSFRGIIHVLYQTAIFQAEIKGSRTDFTIGEIFLFVTIKLSLIFSI